MTTASTTAPASSPLALTLTQPWATLVAHGHKKVETRSWPTAYRGPLVIHAAKSLPPSVRSAVNTEPLRSLLARLGILHQLDDLPRGCGLATCELVDCVPTEAWITGNLRLTDAERAFGDYTPGRYAWLFDHVTPFPEPVPAQGALGLWRWEP